MKTFREILIEAKSLAGSWINFKGKLYGPFDSYEGAEYRIRLSGVNDQKRQANVVTYDKDELEAVSDPDYKGQEDYHDPKNIKPIEAFKFPKHFSLAFVQQDSKANNVKLPDFLTKKEIGKLK
jgi:hypothetical protein